MTNANGETTVVSETHGGKYQVQARVGDTSFLIDEPVSYGGLFRATRPTRRPFVARRSALLGVNEPAGLASTINPVYTRHPFNSVATG